LAGCANFAAGLTALDQRTGIGSLPLIHLNRHRFAGKGRLIDQHLTDRNADVCWHKVAHSQVNEISWNKLFGPDQIPYTVTKNSGLDSQPLLQQLKRAVGSSFLEQAEQSIEDE